MNIFHKPSKFFFYLIKNDFFLVVKFFLKKPYVFYRLIFSIGKKNFYKEKDGIFFFQNSKKILTKEPFIGLSYCMKQCENKFSKKCPYDPFNPNCRKCFAGKLKKLNIHFCFITTTFDLGRQFLKKTPDFFFITACPLAINNFSFIAYLLNIKGIAVPLEGFTCKNFRSFKQAELGKKRLTTHLNPQIEKKIFQFLSKIESLQ